MLTSVRSKLIETKALGKIRYSDGIRGIIVRKSSLNIFAQKFLRKCKDTYFILQNKYLRIYKASFGAKIIRDDCALKDFFEHFKFIY